MSEGGATTQQIQVCAVICSVVVCLLAHALITFHVKLQCGPYLSPLHIWRQDGTPVEWLFWLKMSPSVPIL